MNYFKKIKKYFKYLIGLSVLFLVFQSIIELNTNLKSFFENSIQKESNISLKCESKNKLVYFTDSELSKKVAENENLVKYLFKYGEEQCNSKNTCLQTLFVDKNGGIFFDCNS